MSDVPPPNQPNDEKQTPHETIEDPELKRSRYFWATLNALPCDLSGVDLRPLYALARTGDEVLAVNDKEDSWEPRPEDKLNDKYPGPKGKSGVPSHRNLDRWKLFQAEAKEARKKEIKNYLDVVRHGQTHKGLVTAMQLLYEAAFIQGGRDKADNIFVPKGVTSSDMAASLAALHVTQFALDELDRLAKDAIKQQREQLREELAMFEMLSREGR